jgi:tetratricopeptide (TPR) repeat protein
LDNDDRLDFSDLPEGDPLALWRPDAPWPLESQRLMMKYKKISKGGEAGAIRRMFMDYAEISSEGSYELQSAMEDCLIRYQLRVGGIEYHKFITLINNHCSSLDRIGKYHLALPLIEFVVDYRRNNLGLNEPDTAISMLNYASILDKCGLIKESLIEFETSINAHKNAFGEMSWQHGWSLSVFAGHLSRRGYSKLSYDYYRMGASILKKTVGPDGDRYLTCLKNYSDHLLSVGSVDKAHNILSFVLKIRNMKLGNYNIKTISALNSLANCKLYKGDYRGAEYLFEDCYASSVKSMGWRNPCTVIVACNYADSLTRIGKQNDAIKVSRLALSRSKFIFGSNDVNLIGPMKSLAKSLKGVNNNEVKEIYDRIIIIASKYFNPNNDFWAGIIADRATSLHDLRLYSDAEREYKKSLQLLGESNEVKIDKYISVTNNLARLYAEKGDNKSAINLIKSIISRTDGMENLYILYIWLAYLKICVMISDESGVIEAISSLSCICRSRKSLNFNEILQLMEVPLAASALQSRSTEIRWHISEIARCVLSFTDFLLGISVDRLEVPWGRFHANWLKLCIVDGAAEEIPHVLSAIQGREMAAMLLAELEASETDFPEGDPRKLYLDVVRELRQLRLMLRTAEKREELGGGFDGSFDDDSRRFQADAETALRLSERRREMADQRHERYASLMEDMKRLRSEIAELDATFALAYRPPDVSVERLAAGMANDEAKVLLFLHAAEDGAEPVPHACCITADGKAEVLVLDRMPAVHKAMNSVGLRGTARMGMRGGWRGAAPLPKQVSEEAPVKDDALVEEQQADLAALMGEALWQPLRAKFPQVTSWHLATHQDLHVLPVGLGLDPAHTMTVHPGLMFLARKQEEAPANGNVPSRLAMHSDPAAGTSNPIPFVEVEVELARLIWGQDRIAVSDGEETLDRLNEADPPLDALLLAAHGDELDSEPPQTIVWLDRARERMLDTTAVLSSGQRPPVVIASACVAGRVREDSLGEPLGLVSAFFLHGARFVLAPLQPIPDLQAPLVMGLFHRAWRETGDPRQAWQVAREQALTGQWPESYEEQLRAAYAPVMRSMLEKTTTEHGYISVILKAGWNIEPADRAGLLAFEDDDQETATNRKALIDRLVEKGIDQILDERTRAGQGKPSAAIRRICDWTMPFGS